MTEMYWTPQQLREVLGLEAPGKRTSWYRVKKYFAPALRSLPTGAGTRGHHLYDIAHCRRLIDARSIVRPPTARGLKAAG